MDRPSPPAAPFWNSGSATSLASFGIDKGDNDFVIGLIGKELFPLSACIQAMRKTRQTSEFIEKMGPFFVGYVLLEIVLSFFGDFLPRVRDQQPQPWRSLQRCRPPLPQ